MNTEQVKKELENLAKKAAIYFFAAMTMFVAAAAINNVPAGLLIGSAGLLFVGLALQKIIEFDRWPCRHSF